MRLVWFGVVMAFLVLGTTGCGGGAERAQKSAYKAQQNVSEERLKLVDQYKKCVEDAGDDVEKAEACESYLKAADALK